MIELGKHQDDGALSIKVVGIGGAGCNALDRMVLDGLETAEVVAMNTDVQTLTASVATRKVQLGREVTRGLGAGGDPELGVAAAEESFEEIQEALGDASIVVLCAGLGGGTGSGTAPFVARVARERGALVIAFATMPFSFEGRRRTMQAEESLVALQYHADVVICFENDRMGEMVSPKAGIHQAFANADQTISQSVRAVCEIVQRQGLVPVGFDDLRSAIGNSNSRAIFGFGIAEGSNRAHDALERALKNPLMERGRLLEDVERVLVSVSGGPDMTLADVQVIMEAFGRHVREETQILFGVGVDPRMGSRMSMTVLGAVPKKVVYSPARPAVPAPVIAHREEVPPAREVQELEESEAVAPVEQRAEEFFNPQAEEQEIQQDVEELEPAPLAALEPAPAKAQETKPVPEQTTLVFDLPNRGRFEKSEPTIVDGQDLDVPTFLRRNVRIK